VTVIAERFNGNRLNSPNDAVVHPDGSIWFTDPIYGIRGNYEVVQPNGLCFSPDYSLFYVADTGAGETRVWDIDGGRLGNARTFARLMQPDGSPTGADGIRTDTDGISGPARISADAEIGTEAASARTSGP
jgi:gluconolactonase